MKLDLEEATVSFEEATSTIVCAGILRLSSMRAYDVLRDFLHQGAEKSRPNQPLVVDLTRLQFLNSSGITTLSLFVISMRDGKKRRLVIRGTKSVAWQYKSLGNFKRLWPEVDLRVE